MFKLFLVRNVTRVTYPSLWVFIGMVFLSQSEVSFPHSTFLMSVTHQVSMIAQVKHGVVLNSYNSTEINTAPGSIVNFTVFKYLKVKYKTGITVHVHLTNLITILIKNIRH